MIYLIISSFITTLFFTIVVRLFFTDKDKIKRSEKFKNVGSSGLALTEITTDFGVICFTDENLNKNNIICRSYNNKIKKGERVLITDYDEYNQVYIIDQYPKVSLRN